LSVVSVGRVGSDISSICSGVTASRRSTPRADGSGKHPLWTLVDTIASRDEDIRAAQLVEHRAILDATIDGDPDRAEREMAVHMAALSQRIFGAADNPIGGRVSAPRVGARQADGRDRATAHRGGR
jgi:hypothetical protein